MELDKSSDINLTRSICELQQMTLDNSVNIEKLLREAYLLSVKVMHKDMEEWINNELNGYKDVDNLPDYRYVHGELKAYNHGRWIPMQFGKKEQAEFFSVAPFKESISGIVEAYNNSSNGLASYSITDEWTRILNKSGSFSTIYNFFIPTGQLKQIIGSIQNKILRWTIELEKNSYSMKENNMNLCNRTISIASQDGTKANKIMKDLLSACVKLQANSFYYDASEDQRNDYIRDILDAAGYNVKDQTRRGLSSSGKAAGEIDILIQEKDFPVTIIEALNLDSLNTAYLDRHIDKIYKYDASGNKFNIILLYVTVGNFLSFCNKYSKYIKDYSYPFKMILMEKNVIFDNIYSNIKVMKTVHNRNGNETVLYHICVLIK